MKPAANTSASVPEQTIQPNNKKTGAFLGKIKNTATAIVAGLGLVSGAEAGEVQKIGLPNSTISGPTLIQGTATEESPGNLGAIYNTMLVAQNPYLGNDTSIDRITINLSALDIGVGGTLTISGKIAAGTIDSQAGLGGMGFANTQFQVQQQARFGLVGNPMTTIASLDSGERHNNEFGSFNSTEAWSDTKDFSYDIAITQPGTYYLDNALIRQNATGNANFQNFTLSYIQHVQPVNVDTNKNSIPDKWEYDNFGMLTPANGDPDKDGMSNLVEYGFNTNPTVTNPSPVVCGFEVVNGKRYLCVTFPKNPDATNLNYTVESSDNLQTWGSDVIRVTTSAIQERVRSIVPVDDAPRGFLRVKIETK